MKTSLACVAAVAALALAACNTLAPIQSIREAPVVTASGKAPAAAQVRAAIITAGTHLGWTVADAGANRLEATLRLRTHTAVVDIPYSARSYGISLKRSENLNEANGQIHRNFNGWVQNLDREIRTELSRL